MEGKRQHSVVSGIDIFVAVLILIIGFIVIIYGTDWLDIITYYNQSYSYGSYNPLLSMYSKLPWILMFLGIATVVYGVKRLADDLINIFI